MRRHWPRLRTGYGYFLAYDLSPLRKPRRLLLGNRQGNVHFSHGCEWKATPGFEIKKTYRVFDMLYHRFFVIAKCEKKDKVNRGLIPGKPRVGEEDKEVKSRWRGSSDGTQVAISGEQGRTSSQPLRAVVEREMLSLPSFSL